MEGDFDRGDISRVFVTDDSALSTTEASTHVTAKSSWRNHCYEGMTEGTMVLRHSRGGSGERASELVETKFIIWNGLVYNSESNSQLLGVNWGSFDFWEQTQSDICFRFQSEDGQGWPAIDTGEEGQSDNINNDGILITKGLTAGALRIERNRAERQSY